MGTEGEVQRRRGRRWGWRRRGWGHRGEGRGGGEVEEKGMDVQRGEGMGQEGRSGEGLDEYTERRNERRKQQMKTGCRCSNSMFHVGAQVSK